MPTLKPLGTLLNAPDYADRVNLIKKIKTSSGWRFASVVPEANGRLKDRVRINGQLEVHPEGAYYIEWRVGGRQGRRYRTAVAKDEAIDQARRKAIELRAIRDGLIAAPEPEPEPAPKTTIGDAIDAYLRYVKMQRYQHNQTGGWLHIDQQSQFYDRHAQPIAKEHALEHAGHLTLAVSEISQAQSLAKGSVGTDQGLSL